MKLIKIIDGLYCIPIKATKDGWVCTICNRYMWKYNAEHFVPKKIGKLIDAYALRITETQMKVILNDTCNSLIYLNWSKTMKKIFSENSISNPCVIKLYTDHQHVYVEYYDGVPVLCRGSRKYAIRVRYKML